MVSSECTLRSLARISSCSPTYTGQGDWIELRKGTNFLLDTLHESSSIYIAATFHVINPKTCFKKVVSPSLKMDNVQPKYVYV